MIRAVPIALCLAASLVAVAACSVVRAPERIPWTTFVLEEPRPAAADTAADSLGNPGEEAPAPAGPVIRVAPLASAAGADSPRMVYVRTPGTLETYAHHRWADPPAEMLAPQLVAALERTGEFGGVVGPSSRAEGDLLLEAELLEFRMDLVDGARFRAKLRATVSDGRSGRPVAAPRAFEVSEPMAEAAPAEGAGAARRATGRLVDEVAAWVGACAKREPIP
jgi:cholesterol transport system auxiliary component